MRLLRLLLLIVGSGVLAFLVMRIGVGPLASAFTALKWWQFLLVCLPYGLIMLVDTLGWRYAFSRDRAPFLSLLGARVVGEALNLVTAVASVGGEAVKAWLIRRDVPYEESVPSVVIAKTTITMAQAMFLLIGIGIAWAALPLDSGSSAACSGCWPSRSWPSPASFWPRSPVSSGAASVAPSQASPRSRIAPAKPALEGRPFSPLD